MQASEVERLEAVARLSEVENGRAALTSRLDAAEKAEAQGRELVARCCHPQQLNSVNDSDTPHLFMYQCYSVVPTSEIHTLIFIKSYTRDGEKSNLVHVS